MAVGVQEQVHAARRRAKRKAGRNSTRRIAAARKVLDTPTPELEAAQAAWEATVQSQLADWKPLKPSGAVAASGATFAIADDGAVLVGGNAAATDIYTVVAPVDLPNLSAIRLEALPHKQSARQGSGPSRQRQFRALGDSLHDRAAGESGGGQPLVLARGLGRLCARASLPVAAAIDGNPETGWAIAPKMAQEHVAVFEVQGAPAAAESILTFELVQQHGDAHNLGRFRISATSSPQPVRANQGIPKNDRRNPGDRRRVAHAPSRSKRWPPITARSRRCLQPARKQLAAAGAGQGRIRQDRADDAGVDVGRAADDARPAARQLAVGRRRDR